jgi:hypothetical protein
MLLSEDMPLENIGMFTIMIVWVVIISRFEISELNYVPESPYSSRDSHGFLYPLYIKETS